jgi:cytochrome c553
MKRSFLHCVIYGYLPTVLLSGALLLAVSGCGEKQKSESQADKAAASIAAGKTIAKNNCVGCHGMDGKGANDNIPHLASQYAQYLVDSLNAYKEGKRTHAALKDMASGMTQEQIQNVADYYASLPPVKTQATQTQMLSPYEKGKQSAAACATCHGEDGNSVTAGIPNLAGQQPVYFIAAVNDYLEGRRDIASAEKKAMVNALNRVDIESMALYFAAQAPAKRDAPASGDPAKGEPLSGKCGGCHGAHGISSDPSVPSLASQDPQYIVKATKEYRERVRKQDDMHSMVSNVTDQELEHIAAYYAVQQGQPAEEEPVSVQALAEQCDRCHAPSTEATSNVVFPKINGQHKAYVAKALREYRDGKRESSTMHNMSLPYSDALIESLAALYSTREAQ